ncbi:hypothetical protein [Mycobacterium sp.]|uniref:hypothetical protein n=1 Tax=Mycobacterium sp. TaxID=1785 RepID=UPI0011FF25E9|nr:hypothetical protein [Mycobacterium sp.]TAM63908.1 MAG: hypothetical protein EPN51_25820 [Mycobacterium sp.]
MTAPPGGPYGQGPYGSNPYGQDPNWGAQPQAGGPGPYPQGPYPQGGPYAYPPGGQYPYPPGAPAANPYQPPQYAQPGQPFPPGGPYPPGPPPGGSKLPWLIVAGLVALAVIALVATLVVMKGGHGNKPSSAAPPSTSTSVSQPKNSAQNATDCTPNVSGGEMPRTQSIAAGKLSFPAGAAPPAWTVFSDDQGPNLIGGLGVAQDVPGANQWMMTAEVGVTNFVASMDLSAQATKLMQCVVNGPGYANATPTLGPVKTSSLTVDGTKAVRADADVTIADPTRNVKGDSVSIIAVDTKPVTVFIGSTPIGDTASADLVGKIIAALKVAKS